MGVEGQKPLKPYQRFGPEVKLESKDLAKVPQATIQLEAAGLALKPVGSEYLGSMCVHMYTSPLTSEFHTVQQFTDTELEHRVLLMALSNLTITLNSKYGFKHKTTDKRDKR